MTPVRREGEEELAFIWRACEQRAELGWTWPELAEFLNETLGHQLTECSYRKTYQAAKDFGTKIQKNSLDYGEGDRVKHVKFGEGTVVQINDGGRDFEVTVEFDGAGRKKMFASFAKLQKV